MIHIKETEIIPLLKNAQAEYSQKITEGNPKDVEMAERIEEALTQAMDIVYDYQSMADEHKRMVEKYETEAPVIKRGMDFYCCPACGKRTSRNHTHCHWCGKKLGVGQMKQEITMGSLFSGSGGFELAGSIFGIRPIWASEIEPFPILVTTKNFPEMKHLGDINKLNGADLEPVTIIAGGSPCQDMSIAGKREGLDGSRSNLFREQIRIIKEMRESDRATGRTGKQIRPRYMVWENVPGAYSSNKGEDFRCVLEEICQISEGNVSIPRPPKNKWGGKAQSWAMGIQSLGEHLTLNIGECPKEESVSTLSQILEETPHRKYYLSVKACLGILRRAEKRGKELPEILRQALIRQAQMMSSAMTSATGAE